MTFRNVLTGLIFITIWALMYLLNNHDPINRYEIKAVNGVTIMLDTKTGIAWRNVWISEKDLMNSWETMFYTGQTNKALPIGLQIKEKDQEKKTHIRTTDEDIWDEAELLEKKNKTQGDGVGSRIKVNDNK